MLRVRILYGYRRGRLSLRVSPRDAERNSGDGERKKKSKITDADKETERRDREVERLSRIFKP